MRNIISGVLFLMIAASAYAAPRAEISYRYPWVMRSVAALGMGDAYYVKSDSKYAPFYNPAGLTRVKESRLDLIPLTVSLNKNIMDAYYYSTDKSTSDNADVSDFLNQYMGKYLYADVHIYPSYTRKNFTAGIFGASQWLMQVSNPVIPELNVDLNADAGVVVGIGMSWLSDGRLQTGISGRVQRRMGIERSYTVNDIVNGELDNIELNSASGVFGDAGVIYNFYMDGLNPRVGIAVNNLGTNSMGKTSDIPYSVNISAGISPSYGFITSDIIVDIRDITHNFKQDKNWGKRINMGAELRFWDIIALRGGLHQGYPTVGGGLNFHYLELNYAYYQEELGAYAGQLKNKVHSVELVLGF